jgi:hypothetical protein
VKHTLNSVRASVPRILAGFWFSFVPMIVLTAAESAPNPDPATLPPPKRIVVPRLSGLVTIDGVLDERVWGKAAELTPFEKNDGSGRGRESTRVLIWFDEAALYLGWTCRDRDIQATFTERDSKFWEEEVVEFFVTSRELGQYYELQWNPLGGVFDAIIRNQLDERGVSKGITGDWGYTAHGTRSAVRVRGTVQHSDDKDRGWQAEVRIPFEDLSVTMPKAGEVWRANFYRFNRTKGREPELLAWSPTRYPSFHQPSRFGYLEFERGTEK